MYEDSQIMRYRGNGIIRYCNCKDSVTENHRTKKE